MWLQMNRWKHSPGVCVIKAEVYMQNNHTQMNLEREIKKKYKYDIVITADYICNSNYDITAVRVNVLVNIRNELILKF